MLTLAVVATGAETGVVAVGSHDGEHEIAGDVDATHLMLGDPGLVRRIVRVHLRVLTRIGFTQIAFIARNRFILGLRRRRVFVRGFSSRWSFCRRRC
jgi:hypothetical protein